MRFRKKLYLTLEPRERGNRAERIFEGILITIIILNIVAIMLDSVADIHRDYQRQFLLFELFSVVFFTIEYLARIYSIVEKHKYRHPVTGRINYIFSPLALIDLLAFLPFYLVFLPLDLRILRIFRLTGLFRMFKIARYLKALEVFKQVLYDRKEQLLLSFIFILFVLIILSSAMFYIEHDVQPEAFSSIPATMWWGVTTLTTVGYGDMVPMTTWGKVIGGAFSIIGIGLFALPTGILSSGFYERMHTPETIVKCPHCGEEIHEHTH